MFVWNDTWLARHTEEIIDPARPIIDPHHHLWDHPNMGLFLLDELHGETGSGHNVVGTVFVECAWRYRTDGPPEMAPVGETAAVAELAERSATSAGAEIKGIVSHADMQLGAAVGPVLDAHIAAGGGRFRGIRHATALDDDRRIQRSHSRPTPGLMADPQFIEGVRTLAGKGLSFDAWLYHRQITELTALARAVPECTFVLDHLGGMLGTGPYEGKRAEIIAQWKLDMAELATCPNVNVKLGGIGMVIFGLGFENRPEPPTSADLVREWGGPITSAIEQFGPERCMFESNFPVDKMSCSYPVLWNAFKLIAADASEADKALLFHDTASRVYRLS